MAAGVFIVLATHDGAEFLEEQVDSILAQDFTAFRVLVTDDHSGDECPGLLARFARRDSRIQVLQRPPDLPRGATASYGFLLRSALSQGAQYVFCADQDDVWSPLKLGHMLPVLRQAETVNAQPALVHHDLEVVDRDLAPVARSFWSLMGLSPGDESRPQRLLSRNEVTGCALACNRALLEQALPIPSAAIMHDWWLALCAGFLGCLQPIDQRLVRYRQHGANAIGAKSYWHGLNPLHNWRAGWRRGNAEFLDTVAQARAFCAALGTRLTPDNAAGRALARYCELPALPPGQRVRAMRECGLWREQWLLNTVLTVRLLLLRGERR